VRLRERNAVFAGGRRRAVLQRAMLGIDQMRHQLQVIAHRIAIGKLAQARRPRGEDGLPFGQGDAGNGVMV